MSVTALRAMLIREIEQHMKRVSLVDPALDNYGTFQDGQLDAYASILQLVQGEELAVPPDTHRRPVTYDIDLNTAVARGDYVITAENYLTVWLNGGPDDGYELHLDAGEWQWGEPSA